MADANFDIHTVPCLSDNYAFVIHNKSDGTAAVIDVPDATPIKAKLAELGATLTDVFLTHHHWDHVDGLTGLDDLRPFTVSGAKADDHRLPDLDIALAEGDSLSLAGASFDIYDVSGHTVGHLAAHCANLNAVFTADSLMAMGCGRLFEGTPAQMWDSLLKLRALPDDTMVYSGHEYMGGNMAFALSLGEDNAALTARSDVVAKQRDVGIPTVPSTLADEIATNPFLRADQASMQTAIDMVGADPALIFAEIRMRKDNF